MIGASVPGWRDLVTVHPAAELFSMLGDIVRDELARRHLIDSPKISSGCAYAIEADEGAPPLREHPSANEIRRLCGRRIHRAEPAHHRGVTAMSDISDLHGVYATALRWNAEAGILGYGCYDEKTGERTVKEIEFGSPEARFVMDLATREHGYGMIRVGVYDFRLTPVGSAPPPWPGDDFKPALGCFLWNPPLGEVRLETNQTTLFNVVRALWNHCLKAKEARDGLQPVIAVVGRREQSYPGVGRTVWAPVIELIGWVPRDKVPPIALREPTVKPPAALDSQVKFALLEAQRADPEPQPSRAKTKATAAPKVGSLKELLDDEIPED
jgi:hypothetical protein